MRLRANAQVGTGQAQHACRGPKVFGSRRYGLLFDVTYPAPFLFEELGRWYPSWSPADATASSSDYGQPVGI